MGILKEEKGGNDSQPIFREIIADKFSQLMTSTFEYQAWK